MKRSQINPHIVIVAGDVEEWEAETRKAKNRDRDPRTRNPRDADFHLCAEQIRQAKRGRLVAQIHETIYGYSVRLGNLENCRFITDKGRRLTLDEAIAAGVEWANEDPTKRCVIASDRLDCLSLNSL